MTVRHAVWVSSLYPTEQSATSALREQSSTRGSKAAVRARLGKLQTKSQIRRAQTARADDTLQQMGAPVAVCFRLSLDCPPPITYTHYRIPTAHGILPPSTHYPPPTINHPPENCPWPRDTSTSGATLCTACEIYHYLSSTVEGRQIPGTYGDSREAIESDYCTADKSNEEHGMACCQCPSLYRLYFDVIPPMDCSADTDTDSVELLHIPEGKIL